MKKITFLIFLISTFGYSQVGIGTLAPDSTLDIVATNPTGASTAVDGILIPRVDRQRAQNMTGTITSTIIYVNSIATGTAAGTAVNINSTGFFYYDGTVWQKIATSLNTNWALGGNAATTPGTDFIGTTGTQDIRIKTNSTDRWNISDTNSGQLQSYSLGSNTAPIYSFQGDTNTGIYSSGADALDFSTNGTARIRVPNADQIHALSLGTASLPFYSFSADTGIGMWSPTTSTLAFSTTGVERIRMLSDGRISVNNATPTATRLFSVTADATNTTAIYGSSAQAAPTILAQATSATSSNGAVQGEYNSSSILGSGIVGFAGNTTAGTDFIGNTVSANYGGLTNSVGRSFGIFGDTFTNFAVRTGGVLGTDGVASGALGYYGSAAGGTSYAVYGFSRAHTNGTAAGARMSNSNTINSSIGLGIYGGVIGGWIKGDEYGTVFSGKRFSSYHLGKVISNEDYVVISGDENKVVSYASTASQPEISTKGIAKLSNGQATVTFEKSFSQLIDSSKSVIVTCTPMGETKGVFLAEVTSDGFRVKENQNGNSSVAFSWIAIGEKQLSAKQKLSAEILDKDFEANLNGVMHDENLDGGKAIWEQNGKVQFGDKAPENPAKKQKRNNKKPASNPEKKD